LKERKLDYTQFKVKRRCTKKHRDELIGLMNVYISEVKNHTLAEEEDANATDVLVSFIKQYFQSRAEEICPNADERRNILLDLCYGDNDIQTNKEFCWMIIIDQMLKERENEQTDI
jgi:hypothetical protein